MEVSTGGWRSPQERSCAVSHLSSSGHHADPDGAGGAGRVLQAGATLPRVGVLGVLLGEHVHSVGGHLLLGDQNLPEHTEKR